MKKEQLKETLRYVVMDVALPILLKITGETLKELGKAIEEKGVSKAEQQYYGASELNCNSETRKLDLEKKNDNS